MGTYRMVEVSQDHLGNPDSSPDKQTPAYLPESNQSIVRSNPCDPQSQFYFPHQNEFLKAALWDRLFSQKESSTTSTSVDRRISSQPHSTDERIDLNVPSTDQHQDYAIGTGAQRSLEDPVYLFLHNHIIRVPFHLLDMSRRYPAFFLAPEEVKRSSCFLPKHSLESIKMTPDTQPSDLITFAAGFDMSVYNRSKSLWPDSKPWILRYRLTGTREQCEKWHSTTPGITLRLTDAWTVLSAQIYDRMKTEEVSPDMEKIATLFFSGLAVDDSLIPRVTVKPQAFTIIRDRESLENICREILQNPQTSLFLIDLIQNAAMEEALKEHRRYQNLTITRSPLHDEVMERLAAYELERAKGISKAEQKLPEKEIGMKSTSVPNNASSTSGTPATKARKKAQQNPKLPSKVSTALTSKADSTFPLLPEVQGGSVAEVSEAVALESQVQAKPINAEPAPANLESLAKATSLQDSGSDGRLDAPINDLNTSEPPLSLGDSRQRKASIKQERDDVIDFIRSRTVSRSSNSSRPSIQTILDDSSTHSDEKESTIATTNNLASKEASAVTATSSSDNHAVAADEGSLVKVQKTTSLDTGSSQKSKKKNRKKSDLLKNQHDSSNRSASEGSIPPSKNSQHRDLAKENTIKPSNPNLPETVNTAKETYSKGVAKSHASTNLIPVGSEFKDSFLFDLEEKKDDENGWEEVSTSRKTKAVSNSSKSQTARQTSQSGAASKSRAPANVKSRSQSGFKPRNNQYEKQGAAAPAIVPSPSTKAYNANYPDIKSTAQKGENTGPSKRPQAAPEKPLKQESKQVPENLGKESKQSQVRKPSEVNEPTSSGSSWQKPNIAPADANVNPSETVWELPHESEEFAKTDQNGKSKNNEKTPRILDKSTTTSAKKYYHGKPRDRRSLAQGVSPRKSAGKEDEDVMPQDDSLPAQSASPKKSAGKKVEDVMPQGDSLPAQSASPKKSAGKKDGDVMPQGDSLSAQSASSKKSTGKKDGDVMPQGDSLSAQSASSKTHVATKAQKGAEQAKPDREVFKVASLSKSSDNLGEVKPSIAEVAVGTKDGAVKSSITPGRDSRDTNLKGSVETKDTATFVGSKSSAETHVQSKALQLPTDLEMPLKTPHEIASTTSEETASAVDKDLKENDANAKDSATKTSNGGSLAKDTIVREETSEVVPHTPTKANDKPAYRILSNPERAGSSSGSNPHLDQQKPQGTSRDVSPTILPMTPVVVSSQDYVGNDPSILQQGHVLQPHSPTTHSHPMPPTNNSRGETSGFVSNVHYTPHSQNHGQFPVASQNSYPQPGNMYAQQQNFTYSGQPITFQHGHAAMTSSQQLYYPASDGQYIPPYYSQDGQMMFQSQSFGGIQPIYHGMSGWSNAGTQHLYHGAAYPSPNQMVAPSTAQWTAQSHHSHALPSNAISSSRNRPQPSLIAAAEASENKGVSSAVPTTSKGQASEKAKNVAEDNQKPGDSSSKKKNTKGNSQGPQTTKGKEVDRSTKDSQLTCLFCNKLVTLGDLSIEVCRGCTACRDAFYCSNACLLVDAIKHASRCGQGAIVRSKDDLPEHLRNLASPIDTISNAVWTATGPQFIEFSANKNPTRYRQRAFSMHCKSTKFPSLMATWAQVKLKPEELAQIGPRLDESSKSTGQYYIFRSRASGARGPRYNEDADVIFTVRFESSDPRKKAIKRALNGLFLSAGNTVPNWTVLTMSLCEFLYRLIEDVIKKEKFPGVADEFMVWHEFTTQFQNEFYYNSTYIANQSDVFDFDAEWSAIEETLDKLHTAHPVLMAWS